MDHSPVLFNCDEELDESAKDHDWPLAPSSWRSGIEAKVARFLEGSGQLPELISSRPIYDQIAQIKKQNVSTRFKLRSQQDLPKEATFAEYHRANFVDAARLFIHRLRHPDQLQIPADLFDQPDATFDSWKRNPAKFPHFTAFVGLWIYSFYDQ